MIRGLNLRGAVAVSVITMIGIGPLITIPLVLAQLHGSLALAGWILGAFIAICDGLVWAELGSKFPGSGGTYLFLRDAFGRTGPGRLFAFLFVWQNIFTWPMTLATGYIGFAQYASWFYKPLADDRLLQGLVAATLAVATVLALYRRIDMVARLSTMLAGVAIATLVAVIAAGLPHLDLHRVLTPPHEPIVPALLAGLGPALVLTAYDYYGYGTACMVGDEVKDPKRTLPLSVFWSVAIVCVLYILLQLSVLGVVDWHELVPKPGSSDAPADANFVGSIAVARAWGPLAAAIVTIMVLVTAFGSTFGNLLGAARLPYAAALDKLFFEPFGRLHPTGRFPHISLLVMGLLAVPFCFMSLGDVIAWLTAAAVLAQNVAQIGALFLLRARGEIAPYRMWLYPIPAIVALVAWLFIFYSAGWTAMAFGVLTLLAGAAVYLFIARREAAWPFAARAGMVLIACAALTQVAPGVAEAAAPSEPVWGHSLVVRAANGDRQFVVDGKPFFLWGASFFYERIPRDEWRASLDRIRALGFNTIDLYVPWNWHELSDGDFDFDGRTNPRRDLRGLLALIRSYDFKIVLRPGPVIRNEWRNGGYPAWLLERPEYGMAQHELLEGRYPATATLQNAHSDDAAAEWMSNATHMKYAARWLQTVLHEFQPVADRVIAVQLDDDQAAYIDNQTYPAPHLHAYLEWLRDTVRSATDGAVPVYINTYQPKVPGSLPLWEWGNWYQGGAYQLGDHDLADLTFSTLLLGTQRHGPLMQSEFQAGWLAAPEDQQPRPSAPTSTSLALYTLLALGVKGVIDFPPQDTVAPAGWEAPFTNWFYAWDAALAYEPQAAPRAARYAPTADFGMLVRTYGPELASAERVPDGAIAYTASAYDGAELDTRLETIVNATQKALTDCGDRGLTCDLVDLRFVSARDLVRYPFLVVPNSIALGTSGAAAAPISASLRIYASARPGKTLGAVPKSAAPRSGSQGVTLLEGAGGIAFLVAVNAADEQRTVPAFVVPGRPARHVAGFTLAPHGATLIALRANGTTVAVHRAPVASATLTSTRPATIGGNLWLAGAGASPPPGTAVAFASDLLRDGYPALVLQNDIVRIAVDPAAGGRAFLFEDRATHTSVFTMTGALRDDVARQMTISKRDYIAAYTHTFPAGTFNRAYHAEIVESGERASVKLTYEMPDALPAGARFEKTISLEPGAREFTMVERDTFAGDDADHPQHGVSAASLAPGPGSPGDWTTMTAHTGFGVWDPKSGGLATVTWAPSQLEGEELQPFRSSIVLFMRYAPNVAATTTYGYYREMSETAARARFTEITGLVKQPV